MDQLLITLVLGSYVFAAGGYIFTWLVYKDLGNHRREALRAHLQDRCKYDCYYCQESDDHTNEGD